MMPPATSPQSGGAPSSDAQQIRSGWIEAGLFILTITLLNLSYVAAHSVGAHPIVFLVYAMLIAAVTLVAVAGPGPEPLRIMMAPLSWLVGAGIIGMEAFYYLTLWYVTPAEASVLTRLAIPVAMAMGYGVTGKRPAARALFGAGLVTAGILGLSIGMPAATIIPGLALAFACAIIMSMRTYATEFHPWNRRAVTVIDKMRVTGLVLLSTSIAGALLVAALLVVRAQGLLGPAGWLPVLNEFLHLPTILVSLLVGAGVLTAMQYLSFSSVVKIGTQNFIATTAFTPLVTLAAQELVVAAGWLKPMPVDWQILPAIAVVAVGVFVIISAGRPATAETSAPPARS
jgi:drug/metabolite transporter (DMT)-like permease